MDSIDSALPSREETRVNLIIARYDGARERALIEDEVSRRHLPLARRIASHYSRSAINTEDLVQVANIALSSATRRFDADKSDDFAHFAALAICGQLAKYLRDYDRAICPPRELATPDPDDAAMHSEIGGPKTPARGPRSGTKI